MTDLQEREAGKASDAERLVAVLTAEERREAKKLIDLPDNATNGAPKRRALRKLIARYEETLRVAEEHGMWSWECMDMGREVVAGILGEDKNSIAPMFLPEAIRAACYRAATGRLRDEVMPPDACSYQLAALKASLTALIDPVTPPPQKHQLEPLSEVVTTDARGQGAS